MIVQAVDPERAMIAAGVMVMMGIVIYVVRNVKISRSRHASWKMT